MAAYTYVSGELDTLIKAHIRDIPDFPKPGILFKDITPMLQESIAFRRVIDHLTERYRGKAIEAIVCIESRGFIFGAPLAYQLGTGLVPARKKGKLPYSTVEINYALEYGTATIEMHTDSVRPGARVILIDDLLATGGTAWATSQLIERQGGEVVECTFVVELGFLSGREKLQAYNVCTLARYA